MNPVTKAPAAGDKLTYASSTAVATVDASSGTVTGVAAGTATITATVRNASDVIVETASYTVEVADAYKIELSAAPSSLTAGSASTVSATVYQYKTERGYVPYQQSVELTWNAYMESVADLGGSDPSKAVKTTTSSGSSSVTLYTYATGTSKTAVQVPVTVSVTISGTTYQASPLSVSVSPASAPSFAVHEEDYFDPDDFSEAVDGATGRYIFFHIKLRYLSPTVLFVTILSIINSFKIFREIYLLTGDYPYDGLYMLQHFMNNMFNSADYQRLSAAAVLLAIVIVILIALLFFVENIFGKDVEG